MLPGFEHVPIELDNIKEEVDEQVPSPTSLDTRIFNADSANNSTSTVNSCSNSSNVNYFNISQRQKNMLSEASRPIKNEKSIQDSLEYLYEQNNNFINEISNINQLMDKNNGRARGNAVANAEAPGNQKNQFFDSSKQQVDNSFDNFLDQALNSSSHEDNFGDLMTSKIGDSSGLPLGIKCTMWDRGVKSVWKEKKKRKCRKCGIG